MRRETVKNLAMPHLLSIRDKMTETYGLAVLDTKRLKNLVLYSIRGPGYTCFSFRDGTHTPLHTSAPGKALVAHLPAKRRAALLDRLSYPKLTPNTITDRRTFEKRLARVRRAGYATDIAEELICCHCGGVAIRDPQGHPLAALWVSGPDKRLQKKALAACIRHLQRAAARIEAALASHLAAARQPAGGISPCVASALSALTACSARKPDYAGLAKASRVSYSTLRSRFRAETGMTLGEVHQRARLDAVRRLLTETRLPITEIAARAGFCDQKHLSALFKRKTGVSPLAFRKKGDPRNG